MNDKARLDCTVLVAGLCTPMRAHLLSAVYCLLSAYYALYDLLPVVPEEQSVAEVRDSLRDAETEARVEGSTLPSQC
jgi:hypothetical protein